MPPETPTTGELGSTHLATNTGTAAWASNTNAAGSPGRRRPTSSPSTIAINPAPAAAAAAVFAPLFTPASAVVSLRDHPGDLQDLDAALLIEHEIDHQTVPAGAEGHDAQRPIGITGMQRMPAGRREFQHVQNLAEGDRSGQVQSPNLDSSLRIDIEDITQNPSSCLSSDHDTAPARG